MPSKQCHFKLSFIQSSLVHTELFQFWWIGLGLLCCSASISEGYTFQEFLVHIFCAWIECACWKSRYGFENSFCIAALGTNGQKGSLGGTSNLSSSFNSGLNTFGLNNSYGNSNGYNGSGSSSLNTSPQFNSTNNGLNQHQRKELPAWLQSKELSSFEFFMAFICQFIVLGGNTASNGSPYNAEAVRKPTRLEALPNMDRKNNSRKRSGPILNTMGTFWKCNKKRKATVIFQNEIRNIERAERFFCPAWTTSLYSIALRE